jgi:hypothetical protein
MHIKKVELKRRKQVESLAVFVELKRKNVSHERSQKTKLLYKKIHFGIFLEITRSVLYISFIESKNKIAFNLVFIF